jgi:hypothetical protein
MSRRSLHAKADASCRSWWTTETGENVKTRKTKPNEIAVPAAHDWRTTDEDEVNKRRLRARAEGLSVTNADAAQPVFSNFRVRSPSGVVYSVEIRDLAGRQFSCECPDFQRNGLGTCKHVEAVLDCLRARHKTACARALTAGSDRIDVVPDPETGGLRVERGLDRLPGALRRAFDRDGRASGLAVEDAIEALGRCACPALRVSQDVADFLERRRQAEERVRLRQEYERKVQSGEWPPHETKVPLFPYQREGMLHLAFVERALLADEMGLGKTIQAIAACALLHRLGKASRVLVVTPASLKTEWEEQIQRFTTLPYQLIFGGRGSRLEAYAASTAPFFTIVNYEQMVRDSLDVNARLRPDVVVLDEAQRIKNWNTKTAQAVKRLRSRYAFVLTGTPIENRIDELYSIVDFLNPGLLGPLFRFNREFYDLDERGRPKGYRNLRALHDRIAPLMLRRRKSEVESELPARTEKNFFVPLSPEQLNRYQDHEAQAARLASIARRRPLTQQEQEKLLRELAMMRMTCDTNYILDPEDRVCPKLTEMASILDECLRDPEVKVIVFSEWERMLELVRGWCDRSRIGYAWHTGAVPQRRRRAEITAFKTDPACRLFLSTDSGSTGLNLQCASLVINCDLPWNPAKLEQRIARAWRKNQTRPVTVINLVAEKTIESRMLDTLGAKQALADGVLDLRGNLDEIRMPSGKQAFLSRLQQLIATPPTETPPQPERRKPLPVDRSAAFAEAAAQLLRGGCLQCEERFPLDGPHSVILVVVDRDAQTWKERLKPVHQEFFGPGISDPLAPVQLEVVDRETNEAIKRLADAGLVQTATRAVRGLYPREAAATAAPNLSDEDRGRVESFQQSAARKVKTARALLAGDLAEEAREALLQAVVAQAKALSVVHRLPEPTDAEQAVRAPIAPFWAERHDLLREFVRDASKPWNHVLDLLQAATASALA